jgi:hypothetical protein
MDVVVAPVLQCSTPAPGDAFRVDVPLQLSVTDTNGAEGVPPGSALAVPFELVHPNALVVVTEYVPTLVTVIEDVVSVVLQSNEPEALVDKVEVVSQ